LGLSFGAAVSITRIPMPRTASAAVTRGDAFRVSSPVQKVTHPAQFSWIAPSQQLRQVAEYLTLIDENNITHPYTEALLSAVPIPDPDAEQKEIRLTGNVPSALNPPPGCRFHTRCPRRNMLPEGGRICEEQVPPWRESGKGHRILCHIPLENLMNIEAVVHTAAA
jgi:oligopeptide/dipeptide ABC transporter ATP-binding protein